MVGLTSLPVYFCITHGIFYNASCKECQQQNINNTERKTMFGRYYGAKKKDKQETVGRFHRGYVIADEVDNMIEWYKTHGYDALSIVVYLPEKDVKDFTSYLGYICVGNPNLVAEIGLMPSQNELRHLDYFLYRQIRIYIQR